MKDMAKERNTGLNPDEVKAGMLTLGNVSFKETGKTLFALYRDKRLRIIEPFADMVREGLLKASASSTAKMQGAVRALRLPHGAYDMPETTMTQLYNSFCRDLRNVLAVAKADRRYEEAWKRLITDLEVDTLQLRKELGREVRVEYCNGWNRDIYPELLFSPLIVTKLWETYSRDYRNYFLHGTLSMDVATRIRLIDLFFGEDFRRPHLADELPGEIPLKVEDFEQDTPADLVVLDGVALNGSILCDNGSISASAVTKIKKMTGIRDFSMASGQWLPDRVEMLCLTYFTMISDKSEEKETDILRLARYAVDVMPGKIAGPMFNTFIPAMQGFTKTWTVGSYAPGVAAAAQYLLSESAERWISLDNFRIRLLCSGIKGNVNQIIINSYLNLFSGKERDKNKLVRRIDKEHDKDPEWTVAPIKWFDEVGLKFALHWVKYLCALGMVEIAVDPDPLHMESDPMEGMRFARLTPLGRYALRLESSYTPKPSGKGCDLDFDSENSIITVDTKSPFQMFLASVARKISPTRFRISAETLIKGTSSKSELEQRIKNLRMMIDPVKEPAIQKIIDEAMSHTDCVVRDGGYTLLRLRSDLPGLREAILTDRELRGMTILAGATLALVKTHKMDRFNAICAAYGYLME